PSVEAHGAGSEITVGAALWDILDDAASADLTPGVDDDLLARPMADPWDVIENVLPLPTVMNVSLEDFWDGWFKPGASKGFQPEMEAAFDALDVRYRPDAAEPDGSFASAAMVPATGAPQARTFHPVFDADHARFDATAGQTYVVETTDLLSDGNTHLTVYAPDQSTIIGVNDDRSASDPSSRIQFTAVASGPHYAKVVHAADLGVYGTYALRVLRASNPGATTFTDVAAAAGVANAGNSRGCAWGDVDADGDPDLFVANLGGTSVLYRNQGGLFADRTAAWGVFVGGDAEGGSWCDYDKDGDLDLFVTSIGPCHLMQNRRADSGDSVFVDVTAAAGLDRVFEGRSAAWADADRDGFADLYVTDAAGAPALFRNDGDGTFTDIAATAGVLFPGASISAAWCDYDRDGDDDLYVVGDETHARLYRNMLRESGTLAFDDVTTAAGVGAGSNGFACEWGDFDGDGRLDLYVADGGGTNRLYRNRGDGGFDDVAALRNVVVPQFSTAGTWGDMDNDADLDLFVGNLMQAGIAGTNQLFENVGSQFTASPQLAASLPTRSAAWADYDRDGDLDLYLTLANGQPNQLLRNNSTNPRSVEIALLGRTSNRDGYGATVRVRTGPRVQHRVVSGGSGFGSQPSAALEFGLANATTADSVVVDWPSGRRSVLTAVPQGAHVIDELTAVDAPALPAAAFVLALAAPVPQPARGGACRIAFTVPGSAGDGATVIRLRLLDVAGRERRVLADGAHAPGPVVVAFDGRDAAGHRLAAGIYFVELSAGAGRAAHKLVVLP
ncbi:MAG: FG-GAP-like repeat-containing protein, partial [Candidatus Eisenbacteria bacterium]